MRGADKRAVGKDGRTDGRTGGGRGRPADGRAAEHIVLAHRGARAVYEPQPRMRPMGPQGWATFVADQVRLAADQARHRTGGHTQGGTGVWSTNKFPRGCQNNTGRTIPKGTNRAAVGAATTRITTSRGRVTRSTNHAKGAATTGCPRCRIQHVPNAACVDPRAGRARTRGQGRVAGAGSGESDRSTNCLGNANTVALLP